MIRKVPIIFKRDKGPPTPNFEIVAHLLDSDATTSLAFDKEKIGDQHGGVGIKMSFACDLLEDIENLDKHPAKTFVDGQTWGINPLVFRAFIRNVDVFLFELYSILDYFAFELSEIYGLKWKTKRGRIMDVKSFMQLKCAMDLNPSIKKAVDALVAQSWFDYFHRLRVRITHRMPADFAGALVFQDGKIIKFDYPFLPDNPNEIKLTLEQRRPLVEESRKWREGIFSFVDDVCGVLVTLFETPSL